MIDAVIEEKIDSLLRCLERVKLNTPASAAELANNVDAQDILSLNLERAVQLCVDISLHLLSQTNLPAPNNMADSFLSLAVAGLVSREVADRMVKAVGFRNLSVHAYRKIDWSIVFAIATKHLDDFRQFMNEVLRSANTTPPRP